MFLWQRYKLVQTFSWRKIHYFVNIKNLSNWNKAIYQISAFSKLYQYQNYYKELCQIQWKIFIPIWFTGRCRKHGKMYSRRKEWFEWKYCSLYFKNTFSRHKILINKTLRIGLHLVLQWSYSVLSKSSYLNTSSLGNLIKLTKISFHMKSKIKKLKCCANNVTVMMSCPRFKDYKIQWLDGGLSCQLLAKSAAI